MIQVAVSLRMKSSACLLIGGILLATSAGSSQPRADEIIANAVAKRERDKLACKAFTNMSEKQEIRYDDDFNPREVKTLRLKIYHIDTVEVAELLYMDSDGEVAEPEKIRVKAEEMDKKWRDEQKDEKKGSRDDFVDPLTEAGGNDYTYELVDTRDSAFSRILGAVTATDSAGEAVVFDESIEQLLTYYVVRATSNVEDQRHINATYWIDSESFGVLHQEFSPTKRPRFVDRLDFQLDFQAVRINGEVVHVPQRFELKGKAGFLFFKGHFGVIETFTDYKCEPDLMAPPSEKRYYYRGSDNQES